MTKLNIVHLGAAGFPRGMAEVQRAYLLAKGLVHNNASVTVVLRSGYYPLEDGIKIKADGTHDGIHYIYASGSPYRPGNFFLRTWHKIIGSFNETGILRSIHAQEPISVAIISSLDICRILRYRVLSKLIGFKLILDYVEMEGAREHNHFYQKVFGYLYDRFSCRLVDGALAISHFLKDHIERSAPSKPTLSVPVIVESKRFARDMGVTKERQNYVLYCGSLSYFGVVQFILDVYKGLLSGKNDPVLYLIVHGARKRFEELALTITDLDLDEHVEVFTQVGDDKLAELYAGATALLIPLRPTIQDRARFPHKIGEYLASGRPVITTAVGEVQYYLEHGKNAFIADAYDVTDYRNTLQYALDNPDLANDVGLAGQAIARQTFDYRIQSKRIFEFIKREF